MITTPTFNDQNNQRMVTAISQLAEGRSNAVGSVTLTAGATSTVVSFLNCSSESAVFLFPKTANAAAALATTYVGTVANKSFTVTHANDASTDRSFWFACIG